MRNYQSEVGNTEKEINGGPGRIRKNYLENIKIIFVLVRSASYRSDAERL
jgi:hypothetical protein